MNLPIRVIWEGKASSSYDRGTIDRRLDALKSVSTEEARREIEFLENLKQSMVADDPREAT